MEEVGVGLGLAFVLLVFLAVLNPWRFRRKVRSIIHEHASTLARRRAQLVRVDDYGVEIDRAWRREIDHFFENVMLPRFGTGGRRAAEARRAEIARLIDQTAIEHRKALPRQEERRAASGLDFEQQCVEILQQHGWSARLTPSTGDQGADIIAEKADQTLVLQCKLHSRPVGNKAVQEIAAARAYYEAHAAAVVATTSYTESAHRLARRTGVHLLHIDDLHDLEGRLRDPAELD